MAKFGIVTTLISAVLLQSFAAADQLSEYRRRCETVEKLEGLYDAFVAGRDTKDNETLRSSFESFFQDNFDDTDEWMMGTFMSTSELTSAIVKETEVYYAKVEKFFKDAEVCVRKAFTVNMCYEDLQGSDTDGIEEEMMSIHPMIDSLSTKVLTHIKEEAWKTQFPLDLKNINRRMTPRNAIYKFLKQKYPFRNWMVVDYKAETPVTVCSSGLSYTAKSGEIQYSVYQTDAERKSKGNGLAAEFLARIPKTNNWNFKCIDRRNDIMNEAQYSCSKKLFTMFAVYKTDNVPIPEISSGDRSVSTKKVHRRTVGLFCRSNYLVVIFE